MKEEKMKQYQEGDEIHLKREDANKIMELKGEVLRSSYVEEAPLALSGEMGKIEEKYTLEIRGTFFKDGEKLRDTGRASYTSDSLYSIVD